jgi:hypothetical protein
MPRGSKGQGSKLRRLASRPPWGMPQSTGNLRPAAARRKREPVTSWAAPTKVILIEPPAANGGDRWM